MLCFDDLLTYLLHFLWLAGMYAGALMSFSNIVYIIAIVQKQNNSS